MLIDLTVPGNVSVQNVGGKAFNLYKLASMGLPVPPAIAVVAGMHAEDKGVLQKLQDALDKHEILLGGTKFAVRSSGVGEDGEGNSCAGIFESYLDVPRDNVYDAVAKVWESLHSSRSAMYTSERTITIDRMGVVIQRMIDADYAGVAFSRCPIENDDRVALIELVEGNGDSLVSGKKSPATVRINKLTGMTRVSQKGADNINDDVIEKVADTLLPFIEKIEVAYGLPVDIEWAICNDRPYILQARPITT